MPLTMTDSPARASSRSSAARSASSTSRSPMAAATAPSPRDLASSWAGRARRHRRPPLGAGKSTLVNRCCASTARHARLPSTARRARDHAESLRGAIGLVTQDTSLLPVDRRQHRVRTTGATAAQIGPPRAGAGARLHRRAAGLEGPQPARRAGRRAGRQALGRTAPAVRDRAGRAQDAPILVLDEGDVGPRQRCRARDPASAARPDGGQDRDRDRAPLSVDDRPNGRLVVLDAGRIVEQGTHADLLAAGGHYATCGATSRRASCPTMLPELAAATTRRSRRAAPTKCASVAARARHRRRAAAGQALTSA